MVEIDPSSYANVDNWKTKHLNLDWTIDFSEKVIKGFVEISMKKEKIEDGNDLIILDSRGLEVKKVSLKVSQEEWIDCKFELDGKSKSSQELEKFGTPLMITLCPQVMALGFSDIVLRINYATTGDCTAAQWLTPSQTREKKFPFLFTQCQAIHARSLVPCQDSPLLKITYSASITVPEDLIAVMSAIQTESQKIASKIVYKFEQKIPIPSYLLALAVGYLEARDIGPRSRVYAEPGVVDACAREFDETEDFIRIAEDLLTPYSWGRYDLLVLPGSFPYGGMENPCMTFVTPTLLAGDKSLVSVVAHEIAHSWMGNLVTTSNWQHFWLNEGFTVFIERKIISAKYGERFRQLHSLLGLKDLEDSVAVFEKQGKAELTALVPDLKGIDPDDSFSSVPYEKGYTLLYYLESLVGEKLFGKYLKWHVTQFAHKSIGTEDFKSAFESFIEDHGDSQAKERFKREKVDWLTWFNQPGMPIHIPNYEQTMLQECQEAGKSFSFESFSKFSTKQKILFLECLIEMTGKEKITLETLKKFDSLQGLSKTGNSEIRFRWLQLCLRSAWTDKFIIDQVEQFLSSQGRMKFVRPLFRDLAQAVGVGQARTLFEPLRDSFYHPVAARMISKDLDKISSTNQ